MAASPTSWIDRFAFLDLRGAVDDWFKEWELETRPGVAGVAIWDNGLHARPFTMTSLTDTPVGDAHNVLRDYKTLELDGPVQIRHRGQQIIGEFWVLEVQPAREPRPIIGIVGTKITTGRGLLLARWTLVRHVPAQALAQQL